MSQNQNSDEPIRMQNVLTMTEVPKPKPVLQFVSLLNYIKLKLFYASLEVLFWVVICLVLSLTLYKNLNICCLLGILCLYIIYDGYMFNRAKKSANIKLVPLTHANTADLPATESLIRASQEPVQAQETALLRAVYDSNKGHEAQLLRAMVGAEGGTEDR